MASKSHSKAEWQLHKVLKVTKEEHDEISQMLLQNYLGEAKRLATLSADDIDELYFRATIKNDTEMMYVTDFARQIAFNASIKGNLNKHN